MADHPVLRRCALVIGLAVTSIAPAHAAEPASSLAQHVARGAFEVSAKPEGAADAPVGAMRMTKTFHGGIEGTSVGTMLGAGDPAKGSAGYVAMELVTGTLDGRTGTFVIQQSGTMDKAGAKMIGAVTPGSGTGALAGLTGTFAIKIDAAGNHSYTLNYALPR